jgi:hypothetical protein
MPVLFCLSCLAFNTRIVILQLGDLNEDSAVGGK